MSTGTCGQVPVEVSTSKNTTNMALAWYLTALSNDHFFRQVPPWKVFMRVRTEDLESPFVERPFRPVSPHLSVPMLSSSSHCYCFAESGCLGP